MLRGARLAAVLGLATTASLGLAGCGQSGRSEAESACHHVTTALRLYAQAGYAQAGPGASPAAANHDRAAAQGQLRTAAPLAALAATKSTQWQALATSLGEVGHVPTSRILPSVAQQCRAVATNTPPPPAPATT
ncbi:MAG TPA: hypothetical protein VE152_04695 [Acidimicrobiales bacterium]|nr:hypothetical protein [Acidimicrobiales bacterium]